MPDDSAAPITTALLAVADLHGPSKPGGRNVRCRVCRNRWGRCVRWPCPTYLLIERTVKP